ncbi:MAG TPA: hypothetical protein ENH15_02795 [Actinobacteria bacterium]|nr:hypothetical protein [Actinomycetota bacterium]
MSIQSTVVAVRKQLVTVLAALGLTDVTVSYSHPGADRQVKQAIWCGFANATTEIGGLRAGRKTRNETYTQMLVVEVFGDNTDQEATDTAALALLAAVDGALADDPLIGFVAGEIHWAIIRGWQQVGGTTDRGHASRFEIDIEINARLT